LLTFSFRPGTIERCRKELEAKADLRFYTTPIAMDDLDDVRAALGYDRINLLGISYGTRSAMVYMRGHGKHVRSAVLRAVAPVNMKATLPAARHGQAALQALTEKCLAEEAGRNAYPDIQGELDSVLKDLFVRPLLLEATNPLTGHKEQIHMTRELFAAGIWLLLAHTDSAAYVPLVIEQASHHNFAPFLDSVIPLGLGLSGALSLGASLTTICSEDTPLISEAEIEPATSGTFLRGEKVLNQIKICQRWPRGYLPEGYNQPISSKIPVLMISGEFDPVDGPDLARGVERDFPSAVHIIIPEGAHQPSFPGCTRDLVQAFIERGRGAGLDLSCVEQTKRTPIFIR
jgi:pimeloyl-ACP methyl ester carboxylesterase